MQLLLDITTVRIAIIFFSTKHLFEKNMHAFLFNRTQVTDGVVTTGL